MLPIDFDDTAPEYPPLYFQTSGIEYPQPEEKETGSPKVGTSCADSAYGSMASTESTVPTELPAYAPRSQNQGLRRDPAEFCWINYDDVSPHPRPKDRATSSSLDNITECEVSEYEASAQPTAQGGHLSPEP
ncbi:hypothetical protein CSAL01_09320 [Colletotrichum salicis]|uniref:Uncharacterized protein n=1 Tax=Colletotrichum salicis TaxID=1209931 RepID=A0A135U741_9PEZI|nr:hypothetical protein CSAL01_09320 [Colletotrichum salicis]